jgi:pyruvate dehydrogenase E2 component (dihydrolipoamide acetyltransferase)
MPIEILMPALSPTMKEGNLAKWIKKEGEKIKAGEVIAEIETDKATMEVEAVDEGILAKILVTEGTENVAVNSCIALLLENGEDKKLLDGYSIKAGTEKTQNNTNNIENKKSQPTAIHHNNQSNLIQENSQIKEPTDSQSIKASPLAKRIAREENIQLSQISGSGPKGRIIKDDILDFIKGGFNISRNGIVKRNPQEFNILKNNNIRKIIAKRLLESKQNVPHFYLSCEFKIDKLLELRSAINEVAPRDESDNPTYKISVNDLIIKATSMALKKVPEANSSWYDDAILIYNNIDIAMAVAIDGGLITPIIRNADQKSVQAISIETKQLVKKAREGNLALEEFQGGSFSISNLGMYGIDNFSAIINPPQSCILAVARAVEKPIVEHGQIKIAHMMNVTLSSDHRSVDGAVGAEFLKALRHYIENPILNII